MQEETIRSFFELLRIASGVRDTLPRLLTEQEWSDIYEMSVKHSLVGVVFAAIQSLDADMCPSKDMCREFLKQAEPIRRRNGILVADCVKLDAMLAASGFRPCILKGQSLAGCYGDLAPYRYSSDIDVWAQGADIDGIASFIRGRGLDCRVTAVHVECDLPDKMHAEVHPTPSIFRCPWLNRRLQGWFSTFDVASFSRDGGFAVPPAEFNLVYMLAHCLHHLLFEGVGLRHFMDYYMVLRCVEPGPALDSVRETVANLQMTKFARGVMWIMKEVFGLDDSHLLLEPDGKVGRFLLDEALAGGDFGHFDKRNRMARSGSRIARGFGGMARNARFLSLAPAIVICNPFWRLWHYFWRSKKKYL